MKVLRLRLQDDRLEVAARKRTVSGVVGGEGGEVVQTTGIIGGSRTVTGRQASWTHCEGGIEEEGVGWETRE